MKAKRRPSGEIWGSSSPSDPDGGDVSGRFSSVARESRMIRAGASSDAFSAKASHSPSADQQSMGTNKE